MRLPFTNKFHCLFSDLCALRAICGEGIFESEDI